MENLDIIITIVINQPNDLHVYCMPNKNMKYYQKVEESLVNDNYN